MRIAFSLLLVLHAFIHVLGFVKAFDLAPIAQLEGRASSERLRCRASEPA